MRHVLVRACSVCYGTCGVRVGRDVEYLMYTARDHKKLCAAVVMCRGICCMWKYK